MRYIGYKKRRDLPDVNFQPIDAVCELLSPHCNGSQMRGLRKALEIIGEYQSISFYDRDGVLDISVIYPNGDIKEIDVGCRGAVSRLYNAGRVAWKE